MSIFRRLAGVWRRQSGCLESRGTVHVSLDANDSPVPQLDEGRRVDYKLDSAAPAALVLALEDDNPITGIDEILRLESMLIPRLLGALVVAPDLLQATPDTAFLDTTDGSMLLDVRIDQLRHPVPIQPLPAFAELMHDLHVFLRHGRRAVSRNYEIRLD
jgi:hypothetical protein